MGNLESAPEGIGCLLKVDPFSWCRSLGWIHQFVLYCLPKCVCQFFHKFLFFHMEGASCASHTFFWFIFSYFFICLSNAHLNPNDSLMVVSTDPIWSEVSHGVTQQLAKKETSELQMFASTVAEHSTSVQALSRMDFQLPGNLYHSNILDSCTVFSSNTADSH